MATIWLFTCTKTLLRVRKPNKRAYNRRCPTVDKKIAIRTNKDYLRQVNSLVRYCYEHRVSGGLVGFQPSGTVGIPFDEAGEHPRPRCVGGGGPAASPPSSPEKHAPRAEACFSGDDGVPCAGSFKLTLRESIACVIDYCRTLWIDTRTRLRAMPSVSPIPCDAPMSTNE